jgi:hypothetical protein
MTSRHTRATRGRAARGLALGTGIALAVGGAALGLTSPANAEVGDLIFDLSSEAVAVQSTATDPAVPLGLPFSIGSYGASSVLNSNGESASDAGAPYSPLVSTLPSTGNGIAQSSFGYGLPVVPKFPGYVSAKDPVMPLAKQNAGGYELVATATPDNASGTVNIGGQAALSAENNAFAYARSLIEDDQLRSEAAAGVHALTLDGILDLANFSSFASLTGTADGGIVPATQTNLGTISFAGLLSGLTADGVTALGSEPIPLSADSLGALNEALKPAGITLTYLPEQYSYTDGSTSVGPTVKAKKTVAGVVSGALQIVFTYTAERGTTTETVTIGRVAVNATSAALNGSGATSGAANTAADVPAGATGGQIPAATLDAAALNLPGVAAGAAPGSGLVGAAPTGATLPTQNFASAVSARIDPRGMTSFDSVYLVLALGAAIALLGGQVVRLVAVRLR